MWKHTTEISQCPDITIVIIVCSVTPNFKPLDTHTLTHSVLETKQFIVMQKKTRKYPINKLVYQCHFHIFKYVHFLSFSVLYFQLPVY